MEPRAFVVVTALTSCAAACGGVGSPGATASDAGADAIADTGGHDTQVETRGPDEHYPYPRPEGGVDLGIDGREPGATAGIECIDDKDCDVTGSGIDACSNALFSLGTVYPSPVCIGKDCDPGDGTAIMGCDDARGVCLTTGVGGICLPACAFGADDGAAPAGCAGKDVCNVLGWGKDTSGKLQGVGYCFGGCTADADCTKGDECQLESGLCVKVAVVYTKTLGTACTDADAKSTLPTCACLYSSSTKKGYCSTFCKVGDTTATCPSGYTCSPRLPTTDRVDGTALFTKDPTGLAGNCLVTCTTDSDCTALDSTCQTTASGKVCSPI